MRKNITIIINFFVLFMFSQNNTYQVNYIYDNIGLNETNEIVLVFNNKESLSVIKEQPSGNALNVDDDEETISFKIKLSDSKGKMYYYNAEESVFIFRDFLLEEEKKKAYLINEPKPEFKWILSNETKQINTYLANKAFTSFRGRDYEVWYTTEISNKFGPWKFNGLPGLILEIKSKDNIIYIKAEKISALKKNDSISRPKEENNITFEKYVEIKEKEVNNLVEKLRTKLPRGAIVTATAGEDYNFEKNFK